MKNFTLSFFGNQIFLDIIKELSLFSKFKIKLHIDTNNQLINLDDEKNLIIFFITQNNIAAYNSLVDKNLPILLILSLQKPIDIKKNQFTENIYFPFKILDLEKKIISLILKFQLNKNSIITLSDYTIDVQQRKLTKDNIELYLTEKEINFLALFKNYQKPINKQFILKTAWNYSSESETHTVETHIHRLRKKIFDKFGDNLFIKNNKKGYYI